MNTYVNGICVNFHNATIKYMFFNEENVTFSVHIILFKSIFEPILIEKYDREKRMVLSN